MDMYCLDSVGKRFVENLDLVRASTAESEEFWKPRLEADLILPSHLGRSHQETCRLARSLCEIFRYIA